MTIGRWRRKSVYTKRLNSVLRAIRDINRLIVHEHDEERLIQNICRILTESQDYYDAWIVLLNENRQLRYAVSSSKDSSFALLQEGVARGTLPLCGQAALESNPLVVTRDPAAACIACPRKTSYKKHGAFTRRLFHEGACFGVINLAVPVAYVDDAEEQLLFNDIADDLGYALYNIRQAAQKSRADLERQGLVDRLNTLFSVVPIGIGLVVDRVIHKVNAYFCCLMGYEITELIGQSVRRIYPSDEEYERVGDVMYQEIREKNMGSIETQLRHKNGDLVFVLLSSAALDAQDWSKGIAVSVQDITGRKRSERQIIKSLQEKDVLLKEVHHRVKNNLQIITSLLNLQMMQTDLPELQEKLRESKDRIYSMALVHEHLYQSSDFTRVPFSDYVAAMLNGLCTNYGCGSRIEIKMEVESIDLSMNKAVPCGLLMNEIVVNALKHAFPDQGSGCVHIVFKQYRDDQYLLEVSDNGVGMNADPGATERRTLGRTLIEVLVSQLEGEFKVMDQGGTRIRITFPSHSPVQSIVRVQGDLVSI